MSDKKGLSRMLTLEVTRVTESAAIRSSLLAGRGDEKAADQAAVDAMRTELNKLDIDGTIVIGEGERDEAPMLFIGEKVGTGKGPKVDIALDPLEGTTLCAKAMANSLAVLAMAEGGTLLHAPDTYMDKIAIGGGRQCAIARQGQGRRTRSDLRLHSRPSAPCRNDQVGPCDRRACYSYH